MYAMTKTLCGKYPCAHICSRVEYCPAGQERLHWYALFDRASRVPPPGVNPETGEIVGNTNHYRALNNPERHEAKRVFTPRYEKQAKPPISRVLTGLTKLSLLALLAVLLCLAVIFGLAVNGGNLVKYYEAEDINNPPPEWSYTK